MRQGIVICGQMHPHLGCSPALRLALLHSVSSFAQLTTASIVFTTPFGRTPTFSKNCTTSGARPGCGLNFHIAPQYLLIPGRTDDVWLPRMIE
jgi:hypothetical protein